MTYDQTIKLIKEKRPIAGPNKGFVKQLKEYEAELSCLKPSSAKVTRRNHFTPYYKTAAAGCK